MGTVKNKLSSKVQYIMPYNLPNAVYCITSLACLTYEKQVDNTDS